MAKAKPELKSELVEETLVTLLCVAVAHECEINKKGYSLKYGELFQAEPWIAEIFVQSGVAVVK
jgi:hypothetical protein